MPCGATASAWRRRGSAAPCPEPATRTTTLQVESFMKTLKHEEVYLHD